MGIKSPKQAIKKKALIELKKNEINQRENLIITEDHKIRAEQMFRTTFSEFNS